MEKDQKKLKTTPLGQAVNTVMMEQFPNIVDVKFSADMEKKLDIIEAGKADWVQTIDDFYKGFAKSLEDAEKNMEGKRVKVEDIPTDEICEKCGRPMVIKSGRYGKFVACSGFPECRNTRWSKIPAASARSAAATCWCAKARKDAFITAAATTPSATL